MSLFKYWLGMSFCKFPVAVTNWRINHTQTERRTASFGKITVGWLLLIVLLMAMLILGMITTNQNANRERKESQSAVTTPIASIDSKLIEKLKETIGILQGQNNRQMEIRRETNVQIAGLKKDLEKAQGAIKTLTADYETKLKTANQKVATDLSVQKTSY